MFLQTICFWRPSFAREIRLFSPPMSWFKSVLRLHSEICDASTCRTAFVRDIRDLNLPPVSDSVNPQAPGRGLRYLATSSLTDPLLEWTHSVPARGIIYSMKWDTKSLFNKTLSSSQLCQSTTKDLRSSVEGSHHWGRNLSHLHDIIGEPCMICLLESHLQIGHIIIRLGLISKSDE